MRVYIFLIIAALVFGCSEDEPQPGHWVGTWQLNDPVGPLQISFTVTPDNPGTFSYASEVIHPAIPEKHYRANNMFTYDEFKNENGYGRIEIVSRSNFYYKITLIYNRFAQEEQGSYMDVYDVHVDIEGQESIVLPDRAFRKVR